MGGALRVAPDRLIQNQGGIFPSPATHLYVFHNWDRGNFVQRQHTQLKQDALELETCLRGHVEVGPPTPPLLLSST